MLIVEFLKDYKHTERRTWKTGDTPTLDRDFAKRLVNELGVAKWVGEGCGCPGLDEATIILHNTLASRGITQDEMDAQEEAEEIEEGTITATTKQAKKK
jgi:hypothetical protein